MTIERFPHERSSVVLTLKKSADLDQLLSSPLPEAPQLKGYEARMSRGIKRLANLVESFGAEIDKAADDAGAELAKKRDGCLVAVASVKKTVGKMFDDAAASAQDMLNQISNGDEGENPTSGDSQNSAQSSDKAATTTTNATD